MTAKLPRRFAVRNDVVRTLEITLVDIILGHELFDVDRPCALDFNRVEFLRPNLNIAPTFEFVTATTRPVF